MESIDLHVSSIDISHTLLNKLYRVYLKTYPYHSIIEQELKSMDFIEKVSNACKMVPSNDIPLPLMVIAQICIEMEFADQCIFLDDVPIIREYLKQQFLKHYKPEQIPKLFAVLLTRYSMPGIDNDTVSYLSALKYIDIYEQQLKQNTLTKLSKIYDREYPEESTFNGEIYTCLSSYYMRRSQFKDGIPFTNKMCQYFINKYRTYSCYASISALEFVLEFVEVLIKNDFHVSCKYQLRYKILIKTLVKTFKQLPSEMFSNQQSRLIIFFGLYYTRCCNGKINGVEARKYALKAIKHLNKYVKNSKFLVDACGVLIIANKSLLNFVECKKYVKMQHELRIVHNLYEDLKSLNNNYKSDMKYLTETERSKRTKLMEMRWNKFISRSCFSNIKNISCKYIGRNTIDYWIGYIKNDTYFQIIRNIACLKECNFRKCKRKDIKLLKCKQCVSVYYCSRKHQKQDWNSSHRHQCNKLTTREYSFTIQAMFMTFEHFHLFNNYSKG
eukprot:419221_1